MPTLAQSRAGGELMRRKSGFTITELLVAAIIFALTFAVLFYASISIQDNMAINSGILSITEAGCFALSRISDDIREAETVKSYYSSYAGGDAVLILEVPFTNSAGQVAGYDTVIYALDASDPSKLRRMVYAAPGSPRKAASEIVAEGVKTLQFSSGGTALSSVAYISAVKTVTVKIETAKTVAGVERLNEMVTSASLRNKKIGL
jgi:Tfp pilus assembly protein PilW